MTAAEPWLPSTALFDGALTTALSGTVNAWREAWIATPGKMTTRLSTCSGANASIVEGIGTACGNCLLLYEPEQTLSLGAAMIGLKLSRHATKKGDVALMTQLASAARRSLLRTICLQLGIEPAVKPATPGDSASRTKANPSLQFAVSGSFGKACEIIVSPGAAAAARKKLAKPSDSVRPLSRPLDALNRHASRVSARVGSCTINQTDLKSLVAGDVLVLDRRLDDDFELILDGQSVDRRKLAARRNGSDLFLFQPSEDSPI